MQYVLSVKNRRFWYSGCYNDAVVVRADPALESFTSVLNVNAVVA